MCAKATLATCFSGWSNDNNNNRGIQSCHLLAHYFVTYSYSPAKLW